MKKMVDMLVKAPKYLYDKNEKYILEVLTIIKHVL
jgi:hypothetical protein